LGQGAQAQLLLLWLKLGLLLLRGGWSNSPGCQELLLLLGDLSSSCSSSHVSGQRLLELLGELVGEQLLGLRGDASSKLPGLRLLGQSRGSLSRQELLLARVIGQHLQA
jgi:hypothetical protein